MRAHVVLPQELIDEIDKVAGKRGRSKFIEETLRERLRREKLLRLLREEPPPIDWSQYPEWSTPEKVSQWVHDNRQRDDEHSRKQLPPPWGDRAISPGQ